MMFLLYLSALLLVVLAAGHSYLGERFVLAPVCRADGLPALAGRRSYMRRILRTAWHVTSVAWVGLASIVIMLAHPPLSPGAVGMAVGITTLASGVMVLVVTRGRHVAAWTMFFVIGGITLYHGTGF